MSILGNWIKFHLLTFVKGTKGPLMPQQFFFIKSDFIPTLKLHFIIWIQENRARKDVNEKRKRQYSMLVCRLSIVWYNTVFIILYLQLYLPFTYQKGSYYKNSKSKLQFKNLGIRKKAEFKLQHQLQVKPNQPNHQDSDGRSL